MSGGICAVSGCVNTTVKNCSKSFYRFPKNPNLCYTWVLSCNREDLYKTYQEQGPEYFYRTFRICSDHFNEIDFKNKNLPSQGLYKSAIPTLLLPPEKRKQTEILLHNQIIKTVPVKVYGNRKVASNEHFSLEATTQNAVSSPRISNKDNDVTSEQIDNTANNMSLNDIYKLKRKVRKMKSVLKKERSKIKNVLAYLNYIKNIHKM